MTIPHPVEIELKLELPPHRVARSQKRMARRRSVPVQQDRVTRYFGTFVFALSAQGVALRVWRSGRRWVQTLKTEGARHSESNCKTIEKFREIAGLLVDCCWIGLVFTHTICTQ